MRIIAVVAVSVFMGGCAALGNWSQTSNPGDTLSEVVRKEGKPSEVWTSPENTQLVWKRGERAYKWAMLTPGPARKENLRINVSTGDVVRREVSEPVLIKMVYD